MVLFGHPQVSVSVALVMAALQAARRRHDCTVVAVVDAARYPPPPTWRLTGLTVLAALVKRLFDPRHRIVLHCAMLASLAGICRRSAIPLIVPAGRDINLPEFVRLVREELRAEYALVLVCPQVFRHELLSSFRGAVNYHNAILPGHRGLRATAWSLYLGDPTTGYTFHHMTSELDGGPVIIRGAVPVRRDATRTELEWEKTLAAVARIDEVFEALLGGAPGQPQEGSCSYHSQRAARAVCRPGDPTALEWDDLERRVHAFDLIELELAGVWWPVTRLRRFASRQPRRPGLAFTSADGVAGEADRLFHLPPPLYRLTRRLLPDAPKW